MVAIRLVDVVLDRVDEVLLVVEDTIKDVVVVDDVVEGVVVVDVAMGGDDKEVMLCGMVPSIVVLVPKVDKASGGTSSVVTLK